MTPHERSQLVAAVQANCHISDARHATEMTLCTYLLQMREFHRWERALAFGAPLARDDVGAWIAAREALWAKVEDKPYQALPLAGQHFEPFATQAINAALQPHNLLYGAGLISANQPIFFLADLHHQSVRDGLPVSVAGHEHARGLLAPPAALGNGAGTPEIVLRREAMARWCWERFEAFTLRRAEGSAFHSAIQAYGLDQDFEAALPRWLDDHSEMLLLHELGEHRAGLRLGDAWGAMRLALPQRADRYARAVRDQLADLSVTLPTLLDRHADSALHVWFANYDGVREQLFPSLTHAYSKWRRGDGGQSLRRACAGGEAHFARLAQELLAAVAKDGNAGAAVERRMSEPNAVYAGFE